MFALNIRTTQLPNGATNFLNLSLTQRIFRLVFTVEKYFQQLLFLRVYGIFHGTTLKMCIHNIFLEHFLQANFIIYWL